jgi:hypothetical protein
LIYAVGIGLWVSNHIGLSAGYRWLDYDLEVDSDSRADIELDLVTLQLSY